MNRRLSDEEMKRIAEDGGAGAMLALWQEASRARESEAVALDALKTFVDAWTSKRADKDAPTVADAFQMAKAAIAKAKGET